MASSSTSSVQKSFKYDVFLSFRGEDTRKTFVDHLFHALESRSIITYKDDEKIEKGNRISDELMGSIEESRFYIIVFSKNYASSSWCLDELVKIMECQRTTTDHTAYPVFYDVEPADIRKQTGPVKRAFAKHRKEEDAGKWRDAMKEAADLAGWDLKSTANGHEAKFIQGIVDKISLKLLCINLSVDRNLVGMEERVKNVILSLDTSIDDIRMIGIKGMGGVGKTTLARTVFDQISNWYEGSSFVENVREVSNGSSDGLKSMQKQILSDVLKDQGISVSGVSDGKYKMKKMLSGRKVLLVLDDVDDIDQLKALAGEPNWFKPGSRIIITTREEQVLVAHRVNFIREKAICFILDVSLLSREEASCLFSRHAFGTESPIQGYGDLSEEVVHYASGLPLTISVLGSFLCDRSDLEWKDALERLKTIPLKETMQKLELSYNALEDDYKEIFLDVACILKGWKKDIAIRALESCGFRAKIGLRVLEQKSLITSTKYDTLGMHDHIEEMGKNIVRRLHPKEPHKHSRLWIGEQIKDILAKELATEATRCIRLVNWDRKIHPATIMKGLRKMKGLRFLHVRDYLRDIDNDCFFLEDMESYVSNQYILDGLQYLYWYRYPLKCLPKKFQVNNVVQLQMPNSNITHLYEGEERKVLDKLTYIDLSNSSKLRSVDLRPTPNLETLILGSCGNLVELHVHNETPKLKFLDVSGSMLRTLALGPSPNLETLILRSCDNLVELHMHSESPMLKFLDLSGSTLRTLDLGSTPNLETLLLKDCNDLMEFHMHCETPKLEFLDLSGSKLRTLDLGPTPNLKTLILRSCYNLVEFHMHNETPKLKSLDLFNNDHLRIIHLSRSPNLEVMSLIKCVDLEELHMFDGSVKLKSLDINNCSKLRTLDLSLNPNLKKLHIEGCDNLVEVHMPAELKSLHIEDSGLNTVDLAQILNLEDIVIEGCRDLVELHMPIESLNLKTLQLSNSEIRTLDLSRTPNLETLYLGQSDHLVELQCKELCSLRCCRELTLCGRFLEVPKDLHRLECLEKLTLSCTKIIHLPNSICMLKHLKVLRVEDCLLLEQLPEDVGRLECLEELVLSDTKIKHLPNNICMLQHMKVFRLEECLLLEQLPEDLGRLKSLEVLFLTSQEIKHLPNSICILKRLKVLRLEDCLLLEQLPENVGRLECLEELVLSDTKIKHLPNSICMLKHLKVLILQFCSLLKQLPEDLGRLECLEDLDLRKCKALTDIPNSICEMKLLKDFNLRHCILVENLPEELGRVKSLKYLDIAGAGITHLPRSIFQMRGLCIHGSRSWLESFGFTIFTEESICGAKCYL